MAIVPNSPCVIVGLMIPILAQFQVKAILCPHAEDYTTRNKDQIDFN